MTLFNVVMCIGTLLSMAHLQARPSPLGVAEDLSLTVLRPLIDHDLSWEPLVRNVSFGATCRSGSNSS